MRFLSLIRSLSLLVSLPLPTLCQTVQQDWTAPTLPDRTSSAQLGTAYTISWTSNLLIWFPTYCAACGVRKVDLWITGFRNFDYTYKIASGINIVATSSYRWTVDVDSSALQASPEWVFRFVAFGAAADSRQQISSAGFVITAPAEASRLSSVTSARSSAASSLRVSPSTVSDDQTQPPPIGTTSLTNTITTPSPPTTTTPAAPAPAPPAQSKAWIAGVVIGPIAGIALGAGLLWLFMRRKRTARTEPQHPAELHHQGALPSSFHAPDKPAGAHGQVPVSELPHDSQPQYLQAGYQAELPAPLR